MKKAFAGKRKVLIIGTVVEIVTTARGSGTTRPEDERIEGKEYEVKEHTRKAGGDKEILVDVYIRIKEPKDDYCYC